MKKLIYWLYATYAVASFVAAVVFSGLGLDRSFIYLVFLLGLTMYIVALGFLAIAHYQEKGMAWEVLLVS